MRILLAFYLLFEHSLASSISIPKCLFKKELYHEETRTCFPPLEQGPCPVGQWLVLNSVSGTGECISQFKCESGKLPVLDRDGGAVCGCPYGKEIFLGSCETLYTPSICGEGWVLLPESFYVGHKICPSLFSCRSSGFCPAFQQTKQEVSPRGTNGRRKEVEYVKDLVCNKKSRAICCPDFNKESLFTSDNLIQTMVPPKAVCRRNPCRKGSWPWVGEDGFAKCLSRDVTVEKCKGKLTEDQGRLLCHRISVRSTVRNFKRNCERRRRWINGRCARIFRCDH